MVGDTKNSARKNTAPKNSTTVATNDTQSSGQDKVLLNLKRVRGQLDGIISMYEDERGCVDIVRQVIAARSSLGRVAKDLLTCEASRCTKHRQLDELSAILTEVFRY